MILDNEFTGDVRVENEVMSLQDAGHQVFVLCFNHGNKKNLEDFYGGQIIRININHQVKKKLSALNNTIFNFYAPYWKKKIEKFISEYQIEVLHVHDLPLIGAALKANKKNNLPIVADLHENYVDGLKHYHFANTFPGNVLISLSKWKKKEVKWSTAVDYLITVIEEAVDRYTELGVTKENISVVPNYLNYEHYTPTDLKSEIGDRFKNDFVAVYVGGFDNHRGLHTCIQAFPQVIKTIPNFKLILVGKGRNLEELRSLASELNVVQYISFEGWQLPEDLPSYVDIADITLIPHLKTTHTDNTIPHKLFQYMYLQKPVVASNCVPIERILNETEAGMVYESGNENDLAQKIIELYNRPELQKEMGAKGKDAVLNKYNWNEASKELVNIYNNFDK